MSFDKVVKLACKPKAAPPKAKYIDAIITATYADDGSVHDICRALAGRLKEPSSVVVFKALITLHQMIRSGSTDNILGHLSQQDILRLRNVSTQPWEGYSPPSNLTHYARYLDVRIRGYKELQHDPIRVQADSNRMSKYEGVSAKARKLRQLTVDKGLLREVKQVQRMIDSLLDCKLYDDDLHDECTVVALRMLLKDLLVLFQAGNEGVINVLEHYFEMSKVDATDALAVYKSFCKQTDNVVEYLSMARKLVNLLNVPVPNLKHAPVSLAKALEEYLQDPNFEQNRIEYKANMGAVDGLSAAPTKSPTPTPSAPTPAVTSAQAPAVSSASASTQPAPAGQRAIQDFFESIQADQQPNMFGQQGNQGAYTQNSMSSQYGQAQFNPFRQSVMQPQATGFMGMQPQMTGFPQAMQFQQQPAFSPQQPQAPAGFSPFQNGASPFLQPQHTMNPMQQQQQSSQQQQQQQQQQLQSQPTGSNPFRQSTFFSPSNSQQLPFQAQAPQTTSSHSFGAGSQQWQPQSSSPAASQGSQQPLTAQPTGSKNPFAPPPGTVPPVPSLPSQGISARGPSLRELAAGSQAVSSSSPFAAGPGIGQTSSGGMSDLASAFITPKPSSPFSASAAPGNTEWLSKPQSPLPSQGTGSQLFSNTGSQSFGSSGIQPQSTGFLQPQATGFTSSVKPFKPTSSFGSTLIESLPPIETQRTGFQLSSQQTGADGPANPFRKPTVGTPSTPFSQANGSVFGGAAGGNSFQQNGFNSQSQGGSLF